MSERMEVSSERLYERLADRVAGWIESGTFRAGERLPSVRKLSGQTRASVTTILAAYRVLEDRGLVEARPQSGYYVRARAGALPGPGLTRAPTRAASVRVDHLVVKLLAQTQDPRLVQLGAGHPNPDLLPNDQLRRELARAGRRLKAAGNSYSPTAGIDALRVQIARRALEAGCSLAPEEIVVTNGATEAMHLSLRAVCRPGDAVAIESPTYMGILQAIELMGLRALEIPTDPRDGMDLGCLRETLACCPVKAVVVVSNFNNPLGSLMPDERKQELVAILAERGIPLIEDDIYGDLGFGPHRPRVARAFDEGGSVLLCSSFSKTLAPGYRIGWAAPGRFQPELERLKFATNVTTATLPQHAIAAFLAEGGYDRHLRGVRRAYARQVARMADAVREHFPEGTRVTEPAGGFFLWVELNRSVDAFALHEQALAEGIGLIPGPVFSARQRYRNFIRLNAAYWSPAVERALVTLGGLVARMAA